MPTIGLKDLYYAKITEDNDTETTYETPKRMGKAMQAQINPQYNTADLRADDGISETAESRGITEVEIGVDELSPEVQADLFGKTVNDDGVLVDSQDDRPPYVAIMFRSEKSNGSYRYTTLYKGKFMPPQMNYETKQETPAFQTPTTMGRFLRRQSDGKIGAQVDADDDNVTESVIDDWFDAPYEETPAG